MPTELLLALASPMLCCCGKQNVGSSPFSLRVKRGEERVVNGRICNLKVSRIAFPLGTWPRQCPWSSWRLEVYASIGNVTIGDVICVAKF